MMFMAWDHVTGFWNEVHGGIEGIVKVRQANLDLLHFMSRFITHFCAPTFIFLAGTSIALMSKSRLNKGQSEMDISLHLLIRGILLILFDFIIIAPSFDLPNLAFGVLACIGACMAVFSFARRLPVDLILLASVLIILNNEFIDLTEENLADDVYVTEFSSREIPNHPYGPQELDVLAPGSWIRGPYPGTPGYSHVPWWSNSRGGLTGWNPGNFYYVGGTSMAAPHVSGIAALMLEVNPTLTQADIEGIMKSTALAIQPSSMNIVDTIYIDGIFQGWGWISVDWGSDATGAGLIQADLAVAAVL